MLFNKSQIKFQLIALNYNIHTTSYSTLSDAAILKKACELAKAHGVQITKANMKDVYQTSVIEVKGEKIKRIMFTQNMLSYLNSYVKNVKIKF